MMRISRRDKVALILVGAAVAVFVLFQFAVFPVWDALQDMRQELPLQQKKLQKYQQAIERASLLSAEARSADNRLQQAEAGLLRGKTPALAAAELQDRMNQFTGAKSIEVRSSEFLPAKALGADYVQVPLGLMFQCRMDQLAGFLASISEAPEYITVPKLLIQYTGAKDKQVQVSMQVAGIMRGQIAAPSQGHGGT